MTLHPSIASFHTEAGELVVGGVRVSTLAERVGTTPFFVYDRNLLSDKIDLLRSVLPQSVQLSYAVKANPMPAVVQHIARKVDALDVASALEMHTAMDTVLPADRISFAGPGKTPKEIRQAVAAGVMLEIESRLELNRIVTAGDSLGLRPRVAIRVNPDFAIKGSGMRMGGGPQQFGVDAEAVPAMLRDATCAGLDFQGFHVFAGSQNLNAEILCEAQRKIVELIATLAGDLGQELLYLNLGGGFGIPYFDRDNPLNLDAIGENLSELVRSRIAVQFPKARTVIELGRFIVGECGVYITRVVDRKVSRGKCYLVVDGGLHHQLAASGNFGQVIRRNYPIAVANRIEEPSASRFSVVGCLCTPLDVLGDDVILPDGQVDDLIAIFQAGAYGLTASPTAFLGHPSPIEVLV